uniref:Uncharacterized protein n=1 Tax=Salix viminalis TaxID=40686 RepID=A0A6N2KNV3_SALVM
MLQGLLTEPKLKKKEEEEAVRRSNALEKNELDTLRKVSRQEYLKKREQKKLEEIRDDIEDEQYLFDGVKLTEAEYHELSTGCQMHMIRKEVVIRRRDFPWPCSVTGQFERKHLVIEITKIVLQNMNHNLLETKNL